MKFHFAFQKILDHRKIEKDIAERNFQEAAKVLRDQEAKIEGLYDQCDLARQKIHTLVVEGGNKTEELQQIDLFLKGQKVRIETERQVLRGLNQVLEDRRELLVQAAREFKTFDKLRENKLEQFRRDQIRRDHKITDEIVVTRAGRNRGNGF